MTLKHKGSGCMLGTCVEEIELSLCSSRANGQAEDAGRTRRRDPIHSTGTIGFWTRQSIGEGHSAGWSVSKSFILLFGIVKNTVSFIAEHFSQLLCEQLGSRSEPTPNGNGQSRARSSSGHNFTAC